MTTQEEIQPGCSPSECGTKEACQGCKSNPNAAQEQKPLPHHIRKVFAVVSGKGGVGKSMVTALTAVQLRRMGYKVGVLDADITGPSIPHMFGIHDQAVSDGEHILPARSANDIAIMSMNLLLPDAGDPVIWRGPVLSGVVGQFWTDVAWGELDVLLIDMPPGTGDVPLTIFQQLPIDGIIVVSSPQQMVSMIVRKAIKMAEMMNIPTLGFVENMSYMTCPDCGKKLYPWGERNIAEEVESLGLPLLAQLPIVPGNTALCDDGQVEKCQMPELSGVVDVIAAKL